MQLSDLLAGMSDEGNGEYASEPPANWRQGRTLYGGLTTAICAEAVRRHVPSLPPLRGLQVSFIGPATGRVRIRPTLLRRGRSAAFVAVDALTDDGICARATLTCGAARDGRIAHDRAPAPDVPGPEECPQAPLQGGPAFLVHFDARFAGGGRPFGGGPPEFAMWVRHRDDGELDPTVALIAVADVLPPAASPEYAQLAPMSSMTWSLELPRPTPPTEWYLLRSASEHAGDGYSVQTMGCWDIDGRCLALSRQVVAMF